MPACKIASDGPGGEGGARLNRRKPIVFPGGPRRPRGSLRAMGQGGSSVSASDDDSGNDGGGVKDFLLDLLKWLGAAIVFGLLLWLYRRISRP